MNSIDLLLAAQRKKFISNEADAAAKQKASVALLRELGSLNGRCGLQIGVDEEFGVCSIVPVGYERDPERGVRLRVVQPRGELSLHVDGQAAKPIRGLIFNGDSWVSDEIDENIVPAPGEPLPRRSAAYIVLRELLGAME